VEEGPQVVGSRPGPEEACQEIQEEDHHHAQVAGTADHQEEAGTASHPGVGRAACPGQVGMAASEGHHDRRQGELHKQGVSILRFCCCRASLE
jgi:hypothetical protein